MVYPDELRPGLFLRVGTRKASWVFEKRVRNGPKRKHTLGTYCLWTSSGQRTPVQLSLSEARRQALEIEMEATDGIDRVAAAEREQNEALRLAATQLSVAEVMDVYESLKLSNLRTGHDRNRDLRRVLGPHLQSPASQLSKADLQAIVDEKAASGRLVYANRLRAYLRAFTKWAARRDYIGSDIGADLDGTGREQPRDRVLSVLEVRKLYLSTFELGLLWGPMIRILLLTGQRVGEIASLHWSEVSLMERQIRLEGERTKNGRPHVTHLSDPVLEDLAGLEGRRSGEFVFTTTGRTSSSGIYKAKRRLDRILGEEVPNWRLHDFRRAMATALAEAGYPEGVVDRIQNHSAVGSAPSAVARVYQQSDLLPQRAAALDRWAEMVTLTEARVIQLARSGEVAGG